MNYHKMAISTVCASAIPWIVSFEPAPMHPTKMLFAVSFDQTTDGSDEVVSKEVG
jgi:hypothetical protein